MAVDGRYLALQTRDAAARIAAFSNFVLTQMVPPLTPAQLEARAEEVAEAEYTSIGSQPGEGDMAAAAEAAEEKGQSFFNTMNAIGQTILNLLAVGLFHSLEQELADLCRDGSFLVPPPRDTKLEEVAKWYLQHFGLDLHSLTCWPMIDELRLCANTVKHAEGGSARQLREIRPGLFDHALRYGISPDEPTPAHPTYKPLSGEDLYVTEDVLREYGWAANRFMADIVAYFDAHANEYFPRGE
jgi:hypothetical protein